MGENYAIQILSAVVLIGLLIGWLSLVMRRHRLLGPAGALYGGRWFLQIFRSGGEGIRRNPWLIWLPIAAALIGAAEMKLRSYSYLRKNPQIRSQIAGTTAGMDFTVIQALYRDLPSRFLKAATNLVNGSFTGLWCGTVVILLLFILAIVLLRPAAEGEGTSVESNPRRRKKFGFASAVGALIMLAIYPWAIFVQPEGSGAWLFLPLSLPYIMAYAFGYSIFLPAVDAAAQGKKKSFSMAALRGIEFFPALLLFLLITAGLDAIANLDLYSGLLFNSKGGIHGFPWKVATIAKNILLVMICIVPLLAVIRKIPLRAALDQCITLWASNWRNLSAFVAAGAVILLIPLFSTTPIRLLFPPLGLGRTAVGLVEVSLNAALGMFVLSSLCVFLRRIQE